MFGQGQIDERARIVFVGSDPSNDPARSIEITVERDWIEDGLRSEHLAGVLPLLAEPDGSLDALDIALHRTPRAQVLHIAGHGSKSGRIRMATVDRHVVDVNAEDLLDKLKQRRNIRLVVLSACHQQKTARTLAQLVDCVIGTSDAIGSRTARVFAQALYRELARGRSIGEAFDAARNEGMLNLAETVGLFELHTRDAIDPRFVFIEPLGGPPISRNAIERSRAEIADRVNTEQDVVLWANVPDWRTVVPHDPKAPPHAIEIDTPKGPWHRKYPPDREAWRAAAAAIAAVAHTVQTGPWQRVHVAVKLPSSLGALLASLLEAMSRPIVFYQESPVPGEGPSEQRMWQPWGPGMADALPRPSRAHVFAPVQWPAQIVHRTGAVAIGLSTARVIDPELMCTSIGAPRGQVDIYHLVPRQGSSQTAIDLASVGVAADQLMHALQTAADRHPYCSAIHVFIAAPLALVMRAMLKVNNSQRPVVVHEYFAKAPGGERYEPLIELKSATVFEADEMEGQP